MSTERLTKSGRLNIIGFEVTMARKFEAASNRIIASLYYERPSLDEARRIIEFELASAELEERERWEAKLKEQDSGKPT